jgi:hypothetical protein
MLKDAMDPQRPQQSAAERAAEIRAAGERANAAAKRAAANLSRAADALRAQGYGTSARRGA